MGETQNQMETQLEEGMGNWDYKGPYGGFGVCRSLGFKA